MTKQETVRVALGESEAPAQGDKVQRPAALSSRKPKAKRKGCGPVLPRGLVDLPAVDLPRPLTCPGYPAAFCEGIENE